jgi:hypothetical protein
MRDKLEEILVKWREIRGEIGRTYTTTGTEENSGRYKEYLYF